MSLIPMLQQADILADLTPAHFELIAAICKEATYQMNELVFAERTKGEYLYIIVDGTVNIELDPSLIGATTETHRVTVATLRRGQSFGEVALVDEGLRSAAARSSQHNTHLILIPCAQLIQLCEEHTQLGYRLMHNLAADLAMKIRNTDLSVREKILWAQDAE